MNDSHMTTYQEGYELGLKAGKAAQPQCWFCWLLFGYFIGVFTHWWFT